MDRTGVCLPSRERPMLANRLFSLLCLAFVLLLPARAASPVEDLLRKNCASCHSDKVRTSGFSVASLDAVIQGGNKHGRAVIAGHPERSPLVKLIKGELAPRMPVGRELSAAEVTSIEDWIRSLPPSKDAAPVTEWRWPYQKPRKHDPPQVSNTEWARNPIDNFVLAKLEQAGAKPAPAASKRVLGRRVYLDLIGMPPSPDEMQAFLSDE